MKKAAGLLLCLALTIAVRNVGALTSGDFQYELTPEGAAVLTRWLGTQAEPEIPDTLGGFSLTLIGEGAFRDSIPLVKAHIPDSVEVIGALAFYNCTVLSDLKLPARLQEIGDFAFAYCSSLQFAAIPEGTQRIGEYAFGDCAALAAAIVPASVSQIGRDVFSNTAEGFALYGSEGSAAQKYALENGIFFGAPGDAPSLEMTAIAPEEPSVSESGGLNQDDEPAGWSPAPENLSGLWLVTTTYESWHGEDGAEKEWNHTWSSPVLLKLEPDGQGTWTQVHEWGTLSGPAS